MIVIAWAVVFVTGQQKHLGEITGRNMLFLVLSGIATGLSWLFYFKALQMGDANLVVPIDKLSVVITMVIAFFISRGSADPESYSGQRTHHRRDACADFVTKEG